MLNCLIVKLLYDKVLREQSNNFNNQTILTKLFSYELYFIYHIGLFTQPRTGKPKQADREFNVAAKFIWLALYNNLIIRNLDQPNKFGGYEKRILGQPVKAFLPIASDGQFQAPLFRILAR